ncbi:helix-turn-helix transcriptional regulator [Streptomyces sp. NPDC002680]|uniref:helix-turn-helix transcriptional regulator n=1 Tax=Streptomyces sp. NPDC002680 TaxID=3364659 RepID=UPI0036C72B13
MDHERQTGGRSADSELGCFLRARRTQVLPADVGLPTGPGPRRTPGLRREEIATLAGVSIDYYTRLERGKETRPSPSVVEALASALRLGETERAYLRDLAACTARGGDEAVRSDHAVRRPTVDRGVELLLRTLRPNPAHVVSRTYELLAANPSGLRLLPGMADTPSEERNVVRWLALHPGARVLYPDDWENQIRGCVARLRALTGTDPETPGLGRLVAELREKSPDFAELWEHYDVQGHTVGTKTFHHPEFGVFTLGFQALDLDGTGGHRVIFYYAEPGTPTYDVMVLLDMDQPRTGTGSPAGTFTANRHD